MGAPAGHLQRCRAALARDPHRLQPLGHTCARNSTEIRSPARCVRPKPPAGGHGETGAAALARAHKHACERPGGQATKGPLEWRGWRAPGPLWEQSCCVKAGVKMTLCSVHCPNHGHQQLAGNTTSLEIPAAAPRSRPAARSARPPTRQRRRRPACSPRTTTCFPFQGGLNKALDMAGGLSNTCKSWMRNGPAKGSPYQ